MQHQGRGLAQPAQEKIEVRLAQIELTLQALLIEVAKVMESQTAILVTFPANDEDNPPSAATGAATPPSHPRAKWKQPSHFRVVPQHRSPLPRGPESSKTLLLSHKTAR